MPASNRLYHCQLIEDGKKPYCPRNRFKEALQANLDELHKAMATYAKCCLAYDQITSLPASKPNSEEL